MDSKFVENPHSYWIHEANSKSGLLGFIIGFFGPLTGTIIAHSRKAFTDRASWNGRGSSIECFHMTSRRPYWCSKTMKRLPCWCPKPVPWEFNSFLMQTLSFAAINLHICWPREWKHSISYKDDVERVLFGEKGGDIMRGLKVANSSGQIQSCFCFLVC